MQNKDIKLSIITPSFNSGKYLEETIQSVLEQTYKNFEFIIFDGGSNDETLEIIKKYEKQIDFWVSEPDNGQTDAINKGFKKATGDLLTWLCADDLLYPDTLQSVVDFVKENKIDVDDAAVIYGQTLNFNDFGKTSISRVPNINLNRLLHYDPNVLQAGCFHSKKMLEKINYLDDSLEYCMDYDLWIRLLQNGKIYHIDKLLGKFRLHDESKTMSQKGAFAAEILKRRYKYNKNIFSPFNFRMIRRILTSKIKNLLKIS